jgi:hypothetical protein
MQTTFMERRLKKYICKYKNTLNAKDACTSGLHKPVESQDRCYDFLNIFAEKISKKLAFLAQNKAKF